MSVGVVLLASFAVTGCVTFGACPAIGWINTVNVDLIGNTDDVAAVEVCADGTCVASDALPQRAEEPLRMATLNPQDLPLGSPEPEAASPEAVVPLQLFSITRVNEQTWRVSLNMAAPETLTLRALSSAGAVLVEQDAALNWRRIGGSERCGGPSEAASVVLKITS